MSKLTTLAALSLMTLASTAWAQTTTTQPSTDGTTTQPEVTQPVVPDTGSTGATGTTGTTNSTDATSGQSATTGQATTTAGNYYTYQQGDMRASRLIGTSVMNSAGESIGDINEIVLQQDGKVAAVVVGVGGFLGMGEREVAIPFSSLKMAADANGTSTITVDATRDALSGAPAWQWSN